MLRILYYSFAWPIILIGSVIEFLVWEFFSDWRWKQRQEPPNLARTWQDQTIETRRQFRELEYKSRRELEETENKFREELKRKEREISFLRS